MAKQEKRFPSGVEKATSVEVGNDTPVLVAVGSEIKKLPLEEFKNYVEITGTELKPIASGALPTPTAGQVRTMKVVGVGPWTHATLPGGTVSMTATQQGTLYFDGSAWSLVNVQEIPRGIDGTNGLNGATLSQLFNSSKVGGYAIDEVVRDAQYVEYISLTNSNTAVLSDATKWRRLSTDVIKKSSKEPVSSGGVYNRLNGGEADLYNIIDFAKYTANYSTGTYTFVLDFIAPNDGYIDYMKLRGVTAGGVSFVFLKPDRDSFTVREEVKREIVLGDNVIQLNAKILKGERLAFRGNSASELGRVGYLATDTLANFYAINSGANTIKLPAKVTVGAFGFDFKFREEGSVIALDCVDKTNQFVTDTGSLNPDYTSNEGYLTLSLTSATSQNVRLLNVLPVNEIKIIRFRAKANSPVTNFSVGYFASNSNIPFTQRVNITNVEQTFEVELQGGQLNGNLYLGVLAANNTGQVIQIRDFQVIDKYTVQDFYNKTLPSKVTHSIFTTGRIDIKGSTVAGGMAHLKLDLDSGDVVNYSLASATTVSGTPVYFIGLLRKNDVLVDPLLWEKDANVGEMIEGTFTVETKGTYIFQTYGNLIPTYTVPYVEVTKVSEILTRNDVDNQIVSSASLIKSELHYFNIGGNYTVDGFNKYAEDDPHVRFDHITFVTLNGDLISVCQRFRDKGGDFNYSEIVVYRSGNGGANWSIIAIKPVTALADANPLAVENNDGTVTIFFVKQVSGASTPRDLYRVTLNKDYTFTDEVMVYDAISNCALGGTPPMRINNDSYMTFYEDVASKMTTRIFKYNHVDKSFTNTGIVYTSPNNYSTEEPGLYELPNGDWCLYYRTNTAWAWASISNDKGVTWGAEFRLLRATWTMSSVYKLACQTAQLEPVYVAAVNEWDSDTSSWYTNVVLQRRYLSLFISKDGLNFEKLGYIYKFNGKYCVFEPYIYEYGGNTLIGWSTMSPDMGGGVNASQGGFAFVNITPMDRVLNYVNGTN